MTDTDQTEPERADRDPMVEQLIEQTKRVACSAVLDAVSGERVGIMWMDAQGNLDDLAARITARLETQTASPRAVVIDREDADEFVCLALASATYQGEHGNSEDASAYLAMANRLRVALASAESDGSGM